MWKLGPSVVHLAAKGVADEDLREQVQLTQQLQHVPARRLHRVGCSRAACQPRALPVASQVHQHYLPPWMNLPPHQPMQGHEVDLRLHFKVFGVRFWKEVAVFLFANALFQHYLPP